CYRHHPDLHSFPTRRSSDLKDISTNADMGPKEIEDLAELSPKAEEVLQSAARSMKLSPRGYHRTIKLARTIADLAESKTIEPAQDRKSTRLNSSHLGSSYAV